MQAHEKYQPPCCMLEINVISAEDLLIKGRPIKKNAVVYVSSDPYHVESTKINKERGSNPIWNESFDLILYKHSKDILVQVAYAKKSIGSVTIPTSDFMGDDYKPSSYSHLLSYRLMDDRGVCCGIINLSVRVKGFFNFGEWNFG